MKDDNFHQQIHEVILGSLLADDMNFHVDSINVDNYLSDPGGLDQYLTGQRRLSGSFGILDASANYTKDVEVDNLKTDDNNIIISFQGKMVTCKNTEQDFLKQMTKLVKKEYKRLNGKQ